MRGPHFARSVATHLAAIVLYLLLAVQLTWPLAADLSATFPERGDSFINTWILDWVMYAAVHPNAEVWHAPIFHPSRYALAFSENLFGIAIVVAPLRAAGLSAIEVYNIALLLGFALSAWGGFVLCRMLTGSVGAALIGGFLYGFALIRFEQIVHLQHVWGLWIPLLLAAIFRYAREPGWKAALIVACAYFMNGITNVHWFVFGSVTAAFSLALLMIFDGQARAIRRWLPLLAAWLIALCCLIPVLYPYQKVSKLYGMKRDRADAMYYSATWKDWLIAPRRSALYGGLSDARARHDERSLFPGVMLLVLAASGLLLVRRTGNFSPHLDLELASARTYRRYLARFVGRLEALSRPAGFWLAIFWVAVGFLGSLGLNAFFHRALFTLSPFQSIRVPARWAFIALIGLSTLAAYGVSAMVERRTKLVGGVITAILALLCWVDVQQRFQWTRVSKEIPAVYQWLKDAPIRGATLELPMNEWIKFEYVYNSTLHHRPIVNGASGFETKLHARLAGLSNASPVSSELVTQLEGIGCSLLVIHADMVARPFETEWLMRELRSGRLAFVRRFDHDVSGDYVFAVTSVEPEWPRLVSGDRFDGAGRTREQNLESFLRKDGESFNTIPFGKLERPQNGDEAHGKLSIYGWAFAPDGVAGVNILFGGGRTRIPAALEMRPDVTARFPWYPQTPAPGFLLELSDRPDGVSLDTDIQVEVIDKRGGKSYPRGAVFRWFRGK